MRKTFLSYSTNVFVVLVTCALSLSGSDKHPTSPCGKPREIASAPKLSTEEQARARKIRAQGMVDISISEDGDVVEAKVVRASSPDAIDHFDSFRIETTN